MMKVRKPKTYNGVRSAKELENFFWDVENYFKATKVSDGEKASVTTMYLSVMSKFGGEQGLLNWKVRIYHKLKRGKC